MESLDMSMEPEGFSIWVTRSLENPSGRKNIAEWTREDSQVSWVTLTMSKVSVPFYMLEHDKECYSILAHICCFFICVISDEHICVLDKKNS